MGATIGIVMAVVLFVSLAQHGWMREREYLGRIYLFEFIPRRVLGHPRLLEELQKPASQSIVQPAFRGLVQDRETVQERDVVLRKRVGVFWDEGGVDPTGCSVRKIETEDGGEEIEGGRHCA